MLVVFWSAHHEYDVWRRAISFDIVNRFDAQGKQTTDCAVVGFGRIGSWAHLISGTLAGI